MKVMLKLAPLWVGPLLIAACVGDERVALPEPERIVLVTIDTLRADHLSAWGHPIETSPFLDRMAAEGVAFRRTFSQSATTKPSHSTIFTSLYPMQHGVQSNGRVLDEEFVTMAEMFGDRGFRTAAFVSTDAPLGGQVNQGFEHWDQYEADPSIEGSRKLYRTAEETVDRVIGWLDTVEPDENFLLWVHLYDPHKPLQPPETELRDVTYMVEVDREGYVEELVARGVPADRPRGLEDAMLYDAEILYSDRQLERLHGKMEEAGLNREALWILTSDHGQGLGAHDWFGHSKQIYNAQLWVPLILRWGEGGPEPRVIDDRMVELTDILPTLADLYDVEIDQIMPMQGRSLLPLMTGERVRTPRWFAFAERSRYADAGPQTQERGNYEPGFRYAIQDMEFKYLLFTEGDDEFYDLRSDPYEFRNLIDDPELADRRDQLQDVLVEMIETMPSGREAASVGEADLERLRALGYIQ